LEKGAWAYPRTAQFFRYPLLSQERGKLRIFRAPIHRTHCAVIFAMRIIDAKNSVGSKFDTVVVNILSHILHERLSTVVFSAGRQLQAAALLLTVAFDHGKALSPFLFAA